MEWFEIPVLLNKLEYRGEVQLGVIDVTLFRKRAHEESRNSITKAIFVHDRWSNMVIPSTPVIVDDHEGRFLPIVASHECLNQRAHKTLTSTDASWWMLARSRWNHVSNCRQRAILQIIEVLFHRDDLGEQLGVINVSLEVQRRTPDDLGCFCSTLTERAKGQRGVVVLNVELPRDPRLFQAIKDDRQITVALGRNLVRLTSRLARHPVHVVPDASSLGGAKQAIEEHIVVSQVPVIREIPIIVVAHRQRTVLITLPNGPDETVHFAVVVLIPGRCCTVIEVFDRPVTNMERLDTFVVFRIERL